MPSTPLSSLLVLLLSAGVAQAAETLDRIDLTCIEQPMKHVVFAADGQVDYREEPPRETAPVQLTVIKTGTATDASATGGSFVARIDSDTDYLRAEQASWTPNSAIQAPQGRLRINLTNNVMTLSETGANSETWFRRFACERLVIASE